MHTFDGVRQNKKKCIHFLQRADILRVVLFMSCASSKIYCQFTPGRLESSVLYYLPHQNIHTHKILTHYICRGLFNTLVIIVCKLPVLCPEELDPIIIVHVSWYHRHPPFPYPQYHPWLISSYWGKIIKHAATWS